MLVRDAVQVWHWIKQQYTIHSMVIYYKNAQEKLAVQSITSFSNDLEHALHLIFNCCIQTSLICSIFWMAAQLNIKTTKIS